MHRAQRERCGGGRIALGDLARDLDEIRGGARAIVRSHALAKHAEPGRQRRRVGLRGGGVPGGGAFGILVLRGEHSARGLHGRAQLLVGDRVRELVECVAELFGATVEERELELREQGAHVGRCGVEQLADRDAREIVVAAREQEVDAVVAEGAPFERTGDRELGVQLPSGLAEIERRAGDPAQAAQRGRGARVGEDRSVVVGACAIELAESLAQPARFDSQRGRLRGVVDRRDLALVDLERDRCIFVESVRRERLDLFGELERLEIDRRLGVL